MPFLLVFNSLNSLYKKIQWQQIIKISNTYRAKIAKLCRLFRYVTDETWYKSLIFHAGVLKYFVQIFSYCSQKMATSILSPKFVIRMAKIDDFPLSLIPKREGKSTNKQKLIFFILEKLLKYQIWTKSKTPRLTLGFIFKRFKKNRYYHRSHVCLSVCRSVADLRVSFS